MDLFWIRCNQCFTKMSTATKPFSITQCGHIFCAKCFTSATKQCKVCKAISVQSLLINTPLQPSLAPYFSSIIGKMESIRQTVTFQTTQTNIIAERLNGVEEKYTFIKKEYWKMSGKVEKMRTKITTLLREMESDKRRLQEHLHAPSSASTNSSTGIRMSRMALNSPGTRASSVLSQGTPSIQGQKMSQSKFFTPDSQRTRESVFRISTCTKVPRSVHQVLGESSGGSSGTWEKKSIFSDYSPSPESR